MYVTDLQLKRTCVSRQKALILTVKDGQFLNISMINFKTSLVNDEIYGTINDVRANKEVMLSTGPRVRHVIQSSSSELELKLLQNSGSHNRFMLHITGNSTLSFLI